MDCEQAIALISAGIDREISADEKPALQNHLAECPACRTVAEAFHLQEIDLRRGFEPLRAQADSAGQKVVAQIHSTRPVVPAPSPFGRLARLGGLALIGTAAAVVIAFLWSVRPNLSPRILPSAAPMEVATVRPPMLESGYLSAKPRSPAPAPAPVALGETLKTEEGQRRRVALPDGSILFVNQKTAVTIAGDRRLLLNAGEVYVEVAPRPDAPFVVETNQREVRALGTKFAVRANDSGPLVTVTQGQVQVSGLNEVLHAGEQLAPGSSDVGPAPRASHLLEWTRDLVAAAESPLIPKREHCGGSLVALDPNGQQAKLSMRRFHVDVHIEDGFARTTIDQTYFNHLNSRLEGTFYFPLPADASLSRLAMYVVDGNQCTLNEGGMAERNYARQVFEQIVTKMQDPALLEWVDGSTFKMRVFPLEGRQEKRIILSYTQKLDSLYGQTAYRFPAGHNMDRVGEWSLHVRAKGAAKQAWKSGTHTLKSATDGDDLILEDRSENVKLDKDVHLSITDAPNQPASRFALAEHEGARYLMLRFRPDLNSAKVEQSRRERRDWVFLYESTGDRDPLVARTQIDVIRTFLANCDHNDTFTILTTATRVGKLADRLPASPENVKSALDALERVHLVGALDVGQAITAAETFLKDAKNPYLVQVGSGIPVLGERGEDVLAKRLRTDVPYIGIGVGKRWSRNFMKLAAERTGGTFTQINPDEEVSWRAFDLFSKLRTQRLLGIKVVDSAEKVKFLSYTAAIAQGEEICAIARVEKGAELPKFISVSGTLNGKTFTQELPVKDVTEKADYLPRTWAKLEIDRLLAENAEANKPKIVELSKQMYVMTPFTSLLVLENEAMYQQHGIDRGRKDHWALYPCPPHIPIVHVPDPNQPAQVQNPPAGKPAANEKPTAALVMQSIIFRTPPRFFNDNTGRSYNTSLTAWSLMDPANMLTNGTYSYRDMEVSVPQPVTPLPITVGGQPTQFMRWHNGRLSEFDNRWGQLPSDLPGLKTMIDGEQPPMSGPVGAEDFKRPNYFFDMRKASENAAADRFRRVSDQQSAQLFTEGLIRLRGSDAMKEGKLGDLDGAWMMRDRPMDLDLLSSLDTFESGKRRLKEKEGAYRYGGRHGSAGGKFGVETVDLYIAAMLQNQGYNQLNYSRPSFTGDERFFFDLISYAPGMNTQWADVLAVVEAEAQPGPDSKTGKIDPKARQFIEQARSTGWQRITIRPDGQSITVTCDGAGRHRYDRSLALGLREQVICDGRTLWHLYPDIAVGAERGFSRFHRTQFAKLVPWIIPTADDLAHGADVRQTGERTIRIVPVGAEKARDKDDKPVPFAVAQYVFGKDGQLVEYAVIEMPSDKVVHRETYHADAIRRFGADGKETSVVKVQREAADAPELTPTTTGLVVLPMPYRSRDHVYQVKKVGQLKDLSDESARTLLASEFARWSNDEMFRVLHERYQDDMGSVGFYTLLAATGLSVDANPDDNRGGMYSAASVMTRYGKKPLAKFLACFSNPNRRQQNVDVPVAFAADSFLGRLTEFRNQWYRWRNGNYPNGDAPTRLRQFEEVVGVIKRNEDTPFAWALTDAVLNRGYAHELATTGFLDLLKQKPSDPTLAYFTKYELARMTLYVDQAKARQLFTEAYQESRKEGGLPVVDGQFRQMLMTEQVNGGQSNSYFELIRQTAQKLFAEKRPAAVLGLAWQVQQHGDAFLADELLNRVLAETPAEQRLQATLAVIGNYWQASQFSRAEGLLKPILDDPKTSDNPSLWRLAAAIAQRQQKLMHVVKCLDKALEIEYRNLPEVINLQTVRQDFGSLLSAYGSAAQMYRTLEISAPADFVAKVVRTADRWRVLDTDGTQACQAAALVLRAAGHKELAWDYLTTPIALRPNEGATYHSLAQNLQAQEDYDLADKAYALAFDTEPTNAQLLWDRAQMLQQIGRPNDARKVFEQLANGKWQPRFAGLQQQAHWQLGR